ncbi:hypothetical protein V6C03_14510 [Methyloligella sp. 2.7D]|uniref:hypothetical protein n=1 Tax=unclassified Methyloligella TaxID=2625955 RepID=UPI00157C4159|nr:hypothetical protein [Methyloligella sp. GL2]QKP77035.1 hypothetical protein HT051_05955 [Methyloligella sp. GL2]
MDAVSVPVARAAILSARFVLAALVALVLAGCTGGSSIPTSSIFGGAGGIFGPKTMSLQPIVGAPSKVSDELTRLLVESGKAQGLTLVPNGQGAPLSVRGYLVATPQSRGASISYIWDVTDTSGKRVKRVSGEQQVSRPRSDPWSGVSSNDLRIIADKTAAGLAGKKVPETSAPAATTSSTSSGAASSASNGSGAGAAAGTGAAAGGVAGFFNRAFGGGDSNGSPETTGSTTQTAAVSAPPMTLVAPVTGAPGDGNRALPAALKKRLAAKGVKLTSSRGTNVYTVQGQVGVKDAGSGKETVRLDWKVIDPNGRRLGTVSQENTIPKGSLSGPWGAIADAAAGAATDGIVKLLPK